MEFMDDFSIQDNRIDEALKELKLINKFLGGKSATRKGIKKLLAKKPLLHTKIENKELSILDLGAGSSDDIRNNRDLLDNFTLYSIDKNKRTAFFLRSESKETNVICCDVFNLPLNGKSFDLVHASLFLHHFQAKKIIEILKQLGKITAKGIIINDLRRSVIALMGIKLLTIFFSKSYMVKNDAPVSVKRGFKKKELLEILSESGLSNFVIKRKWAFRWLIVIYTAK
jgi:ubiquinone/menaquinone biosynthesis C-methylase UbiE